jgi:hypothetical protein
MRHGVQGTGEEMHSLECCSGFVDDGFWTEQNLHQFVF